MKGLELLVALMTRQNKGKGKFLSIYVLYGKVTTKNIDGYE